MPRGMGDCGMMNGGDYYTGTNPCRVPRWYVSRAHTVGAFADMAE